MVQRDMRLCLRMITETKREKQQSQEEDSLLMGLDENILGSIGPYEKPEDAIAYGMP